MLQHTGAFDVDTTIPRRQAQADVPHAAAEGPTVPATVPDGALARAAKRAIDLCIAVPACIGIALLLPVLAIAIRLDSPGPVVFCQRRVGRHGRPIVVYKFRSMHLDAEDRLAAEPELLARYLANGYKLPEGEDPRVTRVGRLLRKSSLDEAPQLWCVVKGTMSLVGPRPVLADELPRLYGDLAPYYLAVKPGVTGMWQVSGRSNVASPERAKLDREYAETWSLGRDLAILAKTIPAVLTGDGAH